MGEPGVATSADVYSQQWNPAKYVFLRKVRGRYKLHVFKKLVDDIFLANITILVKTQSEVLGGKFKIFSLGYTIQ